MTVDAILAINIAMIAFGCAVMIAVFLFGK